MPLFYYDSWFRIFYLSDPCWKLDKKKNNFDKYIGAMKKIKINWVQIFIIEDL